MLLTTLLAAVDPLSPMAGTQVGQEMLNKNFFTAVIAFLISAIIGLVAWLMRTLHTLTSTQEKRISDLEKRDEVQERRIKDRDSFQEKLDSLSRDTAKAIQLNTQTMFVLTRVVEEVRDHKIGRPRPAATVPPKEGTG